MAAALAEIVPIGGYSLTADGDQVGAAESCGAFWSLASEGRAFDTEVMEVAVAHSGRSVRRRADAVPALDATRGRSVRARRGVCLRRG